MAKTAKQLVSGIVNVVSMPDIFFKLDDAINNPYADISNIANIISEDPGLSARLLKIANSSLYSFPSKIETISRAITIIGTKQLRDLTLATSVLNAFKDVSSEVLDMGSFWRHSIACGIAARTIGVYRRVANIERLYVLGLMHDIGRLIMHMEIPSQAAETLEVAVVEKKFLHDVEKQILGYDHCEVGSELMKSWKLPASLCEPVLHHHRQVTTNHSADDNTMLYFAEVISTAMALGNSGEYYVPAIDTAMWDSLGLQASMLEVIIDHIDHEYATAVELFLGEDA